MEAASNILRGVLANDREWRIILTQELVPGVMKSDDYKCDMLGDLGLTPEPGVGITPNAIIQRLVTRKGTTGTQFMFGIKVLGIALFNQFMKTLLVHSRLAKEYAGRKESDPSSMRVGISKIQVSLANFANKTAFFGHPIDIFQQLNDEINVFLNNNEAMLNDHIPGMKGDTRDVIEGILQTLLNTAKDNVKRASHSYKDLNDDDDDLMILDIMEYIKLSLDAPEAFDRKNLESTNLYSLILVIDDYKHIDVSSMGLELCEKMFKVVKHLPKIKKNKTDDEE